MGSQATLESFLRWSMRSFPADHYFVIIWDHGQGWRDMVLPNIAIADNLVTLRSTGKPIRAMKDGKLLGWPFRSALGPPYRSVSYDERYDDELYNDRIENALANVL